MNTRLSAAVIATLTAALVVATPTMAGELDRSARGGARVATAPNLNTPAAELRVALGRLLAEHAFLTMEEMRATAIDAPELQAVAAAVEENTSSLQAAIASVYGEEAGSRFGELWRGHIAYIVDYARASSEDDEAGKQRALEQLADFRTDLADFLAGANPEFTAAAEAEALQLHLDQLTAIFADDHERVYETQREAYAHMFSMADHLALGIAQQFSEKIPGYQVAASPAISLRLALGRLLGEHAILAMETTRAGVSKAADYEAAKGALEDNSADLQAAIQDVYGAEAASAFGDSWRSHIDLYLAYLSSTVAADEDGKQKARTELAAYGKTAGAFLAAANPYLSADAVAGLVEEHSRDLLDQVDAYAEGDYAKTYQLVRDGYGHMFVIGDALAGAIATQFPDKFPASLPGTSTSPGHAEHRARTDPLLPIVLVLFGVAGLLALIRPRLAGVVERAVRRPRQL